MYGRRSTGSPARSIRAIPTDQQKQVLDQARQLSATAKDCDAVEAANKAGGNVRPSDPGEIRLERLAPTMRAGARQAFRTGHVSQPLVAADGILVLMVCSRASEKNLGLPGAQEIIEPHPRTSGSSWCRGS